METGSDVIVSFQENEIPGTKLGKGNSLSGHAWASLICGKLGAIAKSAQYSSLHTTYIYIYIKL
jgi:hypothetical protein